MSYVPKRAVTPLPESRPAPHRSDYPTFAHAAPSRLSLVVGVAAPVLTVALWLWFVLDTVRRHAVSTIAVDTVLWLVVMLVAATALSFSSAMYLVGRAGALVRLRRHRRLSRGELLAAFAEDSSSMTVLVPSYAEEPRVVSATLWSAVLQEFPSLRVVLLIDDKPFPTDPEVRAKLDLTRELPGRIAATLAEPHRFSTQVLEDFLAAGDSVVTRNQLFALAGAYERAGLWLGELARQQPVEDHADAFLVDQVFVGLADDLIHDADLLRGRAADDDLPDRATLLAAHQRLVRIFSADLDLFERKRYVSLSQEANKAMNLNSYLSLMGRAWSIESGDAGDVLVPAEDPARADLVIPDADYVLTLDADSLLVRDYCLRLVHELTRPGNERVAVIQTPYCSFPGAPSRLERVAGATTDLQHLHHLGKTYFGATFWVGANAIIRRAALTDIEQVSLERGFEVHTYIQDRTVIEDTESSMDLAARGWSLINYPERLSYSATPPDFGSLVVQRRRWANGGLIIMPKIVDVLRGRWARRERIRVGEIALRMDYLGSIAWTGVAAPLLMLVPMVGELLSPYLFLTAAPFLIAQASDLRRVGHRALDVIRVQALNMVLLPVNLAGVLKSVQQGITGRKIPFARTPKIADRVAAPAVFVLLPYLLAGALGLVAVRAFLLGYVLGGCFAVAGVLLALAGTVVFVGVRDGFQDVTMGVRQALTAPGRKAKAVEPAPATPQLAG
ncbi:glycosyltransferase family 2 protein [Granulicoccus phenolivorans]|uniref:glycosyltransferase family 2 protein n=1 Tax=Granulicoccus phenolivorans TaxID=266854 RepID=UPI0006847E85|nr:glycosyltransferase family 2 protein [Granulicoccus phenolivorans]